MEEENILITAIQSQQMVEIQFRKETDENWVVRELAPYDIFDKKDKDGNFRTVILGYCWRHKNHKAAPIIIYLDTVGDVKLVSKKFNGPEVKKLINPKELPNVSRDW